MTARRLGLHAPARSPRVFDALELYAFVRPARFTAPSAAGLALALGLASMASSKLRIESLFIDEGFGSLDPESLQIAMDALDSLQAQGRKVAVISHVAEMHERIPVQIQVQRQGNGQSGLKIVG